MTNSEDVFREGLEAAVILGRRVRHGLNTIDRFVIDEAVRLHTKDTQAKDERIKELEELADAAAKSFLARTGERDAAERESSALREKLVALEAENERMKEHLKARHGCDNFDGTKDPDYGL